MPQLTPDQARTLVCDAIDLKTRHAGYTRTCELRADYLTCLTGADYGRFLTRYVRRENQQEYEQRQAITFQNLSAITSPLLKKFGQISRIQDLKRGIEFSGTSERDQSDLHGAVERFGAEGSSRKGSLDDYLAQIYDETSLNDPNAFVVLDFLPFSAARGERAKPYAVLYEAPDVLNFRYSMGVLDYMLVWLSVSFKDRDGMIRTVTDYILYAGDAHLRYYAIAEDRPDLPDTGEKWIAVSNITYQVATYRAGLTEAPAVRLGYKPDPQTRGLTCISPLFHPTLEQMKEAINLKSQGDLTTRLHGFPRRFERAPECPGPIDPQNDGFRIICNDGKAPDGSTCKECGGTGFITHRSEQDVVRLALVENDPGSMFDMSKLSYTEKPDWETITGMDQKLATLERKIYVTVFSSDQQIQMAGPTPTKTATEYVVSREDQNNTLLPFADQKSVVWKTLVGHMAQIMSISGELTLLYEYPRDLKLSSLSELYVDLKAARDAKASKSEIEQIQDDIARKRYESDPAALARYFIKKQHLPYNSMELDEFEYADSSGRIPPAMAVLYFNSDIVFGELEIEVPTFYELPYAERDTLVSNKVTALQAMMPKAVDLSAGIRALNSQQQQQTA